MVVLDESHYIKDHSAQRTKATVPLLKAARRVILLTGTPALNKPKAGCWGVPAVLGRVESAWRSQRGWGGQGGWLQGRSCGMVLGCSWSTHHRQGRR